MPQDWILSKLGYAGFIGPRGITFLLLSQKESCCFRCHQAILVFRDPSQLWQQNWISDFLHPGLITAEAVWPSWERTAIHSSYTDKFLYLNSSRQWEKSNKKSKEGSRGDPSQRCGCKNKSRDAPLGVPGNICLWATWARYLHNSWGQNVAGNSSCEGPTRQRNTCPWLLCKPEWIRFRKPLGRCQLL